MKTRVIPRTHVDDEARRESRELHARVCYVGWRLETVAARWMRIRNNGWGASGTTRDTACSAERLREGDRRRPIGPFRIISHQQGSGRV